VPDVAYSSYVSTETALSAMLDMTYPIEAGPGITKATTRTLYDRVGGDNRVVKTLASNGYGITMVESGWSGSTCGDEVDVCVPSAFLDESTYFALEKTWIGPWIVENFGYSFTAGALNSMDWLQENLGRITHDAQSDLVIAHFEIPHPPFYLTAQGMDQAACFDSFVRGLTEEVSEDTFLLSAVYPNPAGSSRD
jgi:hypothetical protein